MSNFDSSKLYRESTMATNYTEGLALPETIADFWKIADDTRLADEFASDQDLHYLRIASFPVIRDICFHYRFFTKYYIDDLAHVISRLPFGEFKSFLASVLNEELGKGKPTATHLQMYDDFLETIDFPNDAAKLDAMADRRIIAIVEELKRLTREESLAYVIGLRGMGAECLCQVYLTQMHKNLCANPCIDSRMKQIDWRFWDFHVGEADIQHRLATRALINTFLEESPDQVQDLARGYFRGRAAWKKYWDIAFERYQDDVQKISA